MPEREAPEAAAPPAMLPLAGRRVGVTADRRWEEQAGLWRRRGAEVVHGPTMRTVNLSRDERLRDVTAELARTPPDCLVATTGMGLRMWLEAAGGWGLAEDLKAGLARAVVVARGAKSASVIRGAGLPLAWQAPHETMEEVAEHVLAHHAAGARVAVQLFDPAGYAGRDELRGAARELVEVPVYRWALPDDPGPAERLVEAAVAGELDAVTFTSQPAVHQLFRIAAGIGREDDLRRALNGAVVAACVGPVCAEAAREEGIEAPLWPEPPRLPAMVRQVTELLAGAGAANGSEGRGGTAGRESPQS